MIGSAALLVAGCGPSGSQPASERSSSSSAAIAPDVPTGYDPCTQIPQNVLNDFQLHSSIPSENSANGTKWEGCQWVRSNWYGIAIQVTNATIDMIRDQHYQDTQEFTIGNRRAISSRQAPDHPMQQCTVNVEIKGGTLEFFLTNPADDSVGGNKNSCDMAREIANRVVPPLPSSI
ncbi:DUF3558 domain-containing protein [Nocardia miyunensis]|uniref:DUF3558 domain-containing protein n=1 Tax=Nocardia miyunensis TaxID=282684 RepID=UPI001472012F|nr:DUF3558 domain-containing protein [Nocardia miyunensis]